jgi:putative tricarboxylic transport membrane protein
VHRADQLAGLALLLFGVCYAGAAAIQYPYWSSTGPGSGFFPIWLGAIMAVLALLLLARAARSRDAGGSWLPRGHGLTRLATVVAATALFVAVLRTLGMMLATALFLTGILRFVEGYRWSAALGIAVATALVNYLVFAYWLQVPFPTGLIGF